MDAYVRRLLVWIHKRRTELTLSLLTLILSSSVIKALIQLYKYKLIPFNEFTTELSRDSIDAIHVHSKHLLIAMKSGEFVKTIVPTQFIKLDKLWDSVSKTNIKIFKSQLDDRLRLIGQVVVAASTVAYMASILYFMYSSTARTDDTQSFTNQIPEQMQISFDDVAGVGSAKDELMNIVHLVRSNRDLSSTDQLPLPRGVLLYGRSGTGKTLLAKAMAGECGMTFLSCSGSDFVDTYVGRGAARIRDLFARARRQAPSILFIDEIDSLAQKRDGEFGLHEEREQTLNQLLYEMDSIKSAVLGVGRPVIVIAATNRITVLDAAVLRSGRFDYHIEVPLPSTEERLSILRIHCSSLSLAADVDLSLLATAAVGCTGADLKLMVDESSRIAFTRRGNSLREVCMDDLLHASAKLSKRHRSAGGRGSTGRS